MLCCPITVAWGIVPQHIIWYGQFGRWPKWTQHGGWAGGQPGCHCCCNLDNEDVIVAREGLDNKFASEVHVGLTGGFHHHGKAQMCPVACCKARGKGIITRSGWIEDWDQTRWWALFGGAHILMGLVKVALDGGTGTGGVVGEFVMLILQIQGHGPAKGLPPGWTGMD